MSAGKVKQQDFSKDIKRNLNCRLNKRSWKEILKPGSWNPGLEGNHFLSPYLLLGKSELLAPTVRWAVIPGTLSKAPGVGQCTKVDLGGRGAAWPRQPWSISTHPWQSQTSSHHLGHLRHPSDVIAEWAVLRFLLWASNTSGQAISERRHGEGGSPHLPPFPWLSSPTKQDGGKL